VIRTSFRVKSTDSSYDMGNLVCVWDVWDVEDVEGVWDVWDVDVGCVGCSRTLEQSVSMLTTLHRTLASHEREAEDADAEVDDVGAAGDDVWAVWDVWAVGADGGAVCALESPSPIPPVPPVSPVFPVSGGMKQTRESTWFIKNNNNSLMEVRERLSKVKGAMTDETLADTMPVSKAESLSSVGVWWGEFRVCSSTRTLTPAASTTSVTLNTDPLIPFMCMSFICTPFIP
jgi:hypothetical protein